MNEQAARSLVLVGAIESADRMFKILSAADRQLASHSARELAQWKAAKTGLQPTAEDFLQERAEQLVKRVSRQFLMLEPLLHQPGSLALFWTGLPVVALLAGLLLDQVADPHRVDLLSAPLLLLIAWNFAVYAALLVWPWLPAGKPGRQLAGLVRLASLGRNRLPRRLPPVLASALADFNAQWTQLSRRLTLARFSRTLHLASALFAIGAAASLYARGYIAEYSAGWESTFLTSSQVHAALSVLFTPAMQAFGLQGFSVADIQALRFGQPPSVSSGARWVQLYAATLALLVVVPRLLLAGIAGLQVSQWRRKFPLDLEQPYFNRLLAALGSAPSKLRVLPYSFAVDEARSQGLHQLAGQLLGEAAQVLMHPCLAYGSEPGAALRGINLGDDSVTLTAVLFSLSATPENENHGALLDFLVGRSRRRIVVLVDESGYLERLGGQAGAQARMDQRLALWRQFCNFHQAPATIVNLLHPEARPLDLGAAMSLSGAAA